ncbi:MAG: hypothetical protein ABH821_05925 [archaeon]
MMGFVLSKINLLILVIALSALILYFMFSFNSLLFGIKSQELIAQVSRNASALVNSPTYCDSIKITLPQKIETIGFSGTGVYSFYYTLNMQVQSIDSSNPDKGNLLILAVVNKQKPEEFVAAESFLVKGDVKLYEYRETNEQTFVSLNPSAATPQNALMLVKEISGGEATLYVVPCNQPSKGSDDCVNSVLMSAGIFSCLSEINEQCIDKIGELGCGDNTCDSASEPCPMQDCCDKGIPFSPCC